MAAADARAQALLRRRPTAQPPVLPSCPPMPPRAAVPAASPAPESLPVLAGGMRPAPSCTGQPAQERVPCPRGQLAWHHHGGLDEEGRLVGPQEALMSWLGPSHTQGDLLMTIAARHQLFTVICWNALRTRGRLSVVTPPPPLKTFDKSAPGRATETGRWGGAAAERHGLLGSAKGSQRPRLCAERAAGRRRGL